VPHRSRLLSSWRLHSLQERLRGALQQLATQQQQQQQQQGRTSTVSDADISGTGCTAAAAAGNSSADDAASALSDCAVGHPAVAAAFLRELAAFSKSAAAGETINFGCQRNEVAGSCAEHLVTCT
jgi:hypothetical protein